MISYELCLSETRLIEIKTKSDISRFKSSASHLLVMQCMILFSGA